MDKVAHFEVPMNDEERGQKFYKDTFGWNIEKAGDMPYWMARTTECDENNMPKESGAINGGLFKRDEGQEISPVIVIQVENIEESLKKIEEAGGKKTTGPSPVGDMGIYARFEDTEGNVMGLWQPLKK